MGLDEGVMFDDFSHFGQTDLISLMAINNVSVEIVDTEKHT